MLKSSKYREMHTIRHAVNICATSPLLIRVCRLMQFFHQHLALPLLRPSSSIFFSLCSDDKQMKALFCHFRLTAHLGLCEKEKKRSWYYSFFCHFGCCSKAVCACVRFLFISNTEGQPMEATRESSGLSVFDL